MIQDTTLKLLNRRIRELQEQTDSRHVVGLEERRLEGPDKRLTAINSRINTYSQLLAHIDAGIIYLETQES